MARAVAGDFLHSMRFHVRVVQEDRVTLQPDAEIRADAGFSMVSIPEATLEAVEYKEGTMIYTRKQPGNVTISDISMSRGVTRRDSSFWNWARKTIEGSGEYRVDLHVEHFHRVGSLTREDSNGSNPNLDKMNSDARSPARIYRIFEAFPIRHKPAGDLDATASEISIMELDVACERFEVEELELPS
jgi:phage tail-like protein